ncbi:hypothetical protein [Parasedimentitalea marina]|uniref:hypothetical protein n=1 Tax=Parasedimentitalea marina TaxID=2483033 RepID=UPI001EE8C258|nr:hypothetical protein [Parasedimentitalea marina]
MQFGAVLNNALVGARSFLPGRTSLINLMSALSSGETADLGNGGFLGGGRYNESDGDGLVGL